MENEPINQQLVTKKDGKYVPLFKVEDVNRDKFIFLRKQLIDLGCPKNNVLHVAKKLCMDILQFNNEEKYLQYVLKDTYLQCKKKINFGYDPNPIQEINNFLYSHINLFSSIYGYEMDYLKSRGIFSGIADIGCGEGIFGKLAQDYNIIVDGYEIENPVFKHDVNMKLIDDFYDIKSPYKCLIYNHVFEHNLLKPDLHVENIINYFEKNIKSDNLESIIISLPMHLYVPAHVASKHFWVCTDDVIFDNGFKNLLEENELKIFYPFKNFSEIAKKYSFNLIINKQLGIYVFEK